jgi:hypothetical protein
MRELMGTVELDPGPDGTRVAMQRKLERFEGGERPAGRLDASGAAFL